MDFAKYIDTYNDDPDYISVWANAKKIVNTFFAKQRLPHNLEQTGCWGIKSLIRQEFNNINAGEKFDFSFINNVTDTKAYSYRKKTEQPKEVFVVDVTHEEDGNVYLFTRSDGEDPTTACIKVPFYDYFYVEIDQTHPKSIIKKEITSFCDFLSQNVFGEQTVLRSLEDAEPNLKSVYGFEHQTRCFLKLVVTAPKMTQMIVRRLWKQHPNLKIYESGHDYISKFFTAKKISSGSCIDVSNAYPVTNHYSTCDFLLMCGDVTPVPNKIFKPRTLYYDIEVLALNIDEFPTSEKCPIIQISYKLNNDEGVLCLHETPGENNTSFATEEDMLVAFAQIIKYDKPDFITGYNSNSFDAPYILDRMINLGLPTDFCKKKYFKVDYRRTMRASKQMGSVEVVLYKSPGFVFFDQMAVLKADVTKRLDSYALKNVCAVYLKDDNKLDLAYREIPTLFKTKEGRSKIADYCLKDTLLLDELESKLMLITNSVAMTKVLNCTFDTTLNRGLVFKLIGKLKQYTERFGFLIPTFSEEQKPTFTGSYQGAFVLSPDVGYYTDPVVCLDYASLYPSLMIYYNLSYDTILFEREHSSWMAANPNKWEKMDNGVCFVKPEHYFGLLPKLEQELGAERKAAKKKKAESQAGSLQEAVYDGLQLANKVVMNSLYGMLGSPSATVPCVEIASTITAMGRYNLMNAKHYVEENYCKITDQPEDLKAKVIYGDTDSIFIHMPGIDVKTADKFGFKLEKAITRDLYHKKNALVMEFEKTLCPFLLVTAKRYTGVQYDAGNFEKGKLKAMGLQLQKRDSTKLCKEAMSDFFKQAIENGDKDKAVANLKSLIQKLFNEELDYSYFKLSKKISKAPKEYKVTPGHVKTWIAFRERVGVVEAPMVGEHFSYLIQRFNKRQKVGDVLIEYQEGVDLKISVDKTHYFKISILNPLEKPLQIMLGEKEAAYLLNPNNYQQVESVVATKRNLLSFFGIEKYKQTKKSKTS